MCVPTPETDRPEDKLERRESFDLFKLYEEASEKTKTHVWSQTSWILTLSTAILAFSVNLYVEHRTVLGFLWIVWIVARGSCIVRLPDLDAGGIRQAHSTELDTGKQSCHPVPSGPDPICSQP